MHRIKEIYKYYTDKRFSTIAGTLVYFLLMSIAPFLLWLTLVFGNVDMSFITGKELFNGVRPILHYLKDSAESAVGGAGIIFLITSLYSSTNFFYHLRRSGELIYDSDFVKGGIKLRIVSLGLIFLTILLIALLGGLSFAYAAIFDRFLPRYLSELLFCIFLCVFLFAVALVMNIFACPYKMKISEAVEGSVFTAVLWYVFLSGFGIYMNIATPERLYGKIASLIIFLIWCYAMMSCFVIGMIYNRRHVKFKISDSLKK